MREVFSFIFSLITDPLALPISPLYEYIILAVLGEVAFQIAWKASPGGFGGSTIHWFIRTCAFVVMWALVYALITVTKFVIAHRIPVLCIVGVLTITSFILKKVVKQKTEKQNLNY